MNNVGLDGHSTFGHYILIHDYLLKLWPKVILLLVGINDVGLDALRPNDRRNIAAGLDFSNLHQFIVSLANTSEVVGLALNLYRVWKARHMGVMHNFNATGAAATSREPALSKEALAAELKEHEARYLPGFCQRPRGDRH